MCIHRANLVNCTGRHGAVVVIDVLHAFSTATYVFASGAREIFLVRTIEDAYKLRRVIPGVLLIGEARGLPVPGFDFGNSPSEIIKDPDPAPYLERIHLSPTGGAFTNPNQARFSASDLELCLAVNKFDFAMQVARQGELSILTRVEINS